jgi:hypothetical protein
VGPKVNEPFQALPSASGGESVAEIKVERKSPSVWPWIIGLLILALLVWGLTELMTGNTDPVLPETADSPAVQAAEPAPFPESVSAPPGPAGSTVTVPDAQGMTADTAR